MITDHHLWLIDHGICFHVEDKLRTVIWDFAGEPIPEQLLDDLSNFVQSLAPETTLSKALGELLSQKEIKALGKRAINLIAVHQFPQPNPAERSFPWPPL